MNHPNLSKQVIETISHPENLIFVSAVSAWEIGIKKSLGKLDAPDDLTQQIEKHNFRAMDIKINHALYVSELPFFHHDPIDRLLIAQGILEKMKIITNDRKFNSYSVSLLLN